MPAVRGAVEVYRETRKVPDLPWNLYVARPIAAVLVAGLRASRVTPNQITLASLIVALSSVPMMIWLSGYWGLVAAVLVFELSYVLDCADGMLARLRSVQSTEGHLLDFLMDEIKAFAVLAAVALRLHLESGSVTPLILGLVGLVVLAAGIAMTTFLRRPEIAGPPAPMSAPAATAGLLRRVVGLAEGVAKQLIHYPSYLWLVALADGLALFLHVYVAVNALYALRALFGIMRRFGRSAPG